MTYVKASEDCGFWQPLLVIREWGLIGEKWRMRKEKSKRNRGFNRRVIFNMAWCSIPKDEMIQMLSDVQVRLRR